MTETGKDRKLAKGTEKTGDKKGQEPEWASGLKRLYDSVVDEPLPDSFKNLLSKLDDSQAK